MVKIGTHGFPDTIESVNDLLNPIIALGDTLKDMQADVVAITKNSATNTDDVFVRPKKDGTFVTSSDYFASREIKEIITRLNGLQNSGYIDEEAPDEDNRAALEQSGAWVVDPIDCTASYKKGGDGGDVWSIMVGYAHNGESTGGIVYYPALDRIYFTADNGNSYLWERGETNTVIELSGTVPNMTKGLSVATRSNTQLNSTFNQHAQHKERSFQRYWGGVLPNIFEPNEGRLSGMDVTHFPPHLKAWDVVAVLAIADKAGHAAYNMDGTPFKPFQDQDQPFSIPADGFYTCHPGTHQHIMTQEHTSQQQLHA